MQRLCSFLSLLILVFVGSIATAQSNRPDGERVYDIIVVTADPPTPRCEHLRSMFAAGGPLHSLTKTCNFFDFKTSNPLYIAEFGEELPPNRMPALSMSRRDGGVVYKATGGNITTAAALKAGMMRGVQTDKALRNGGDQWTSQDCPDCPYREPTQPSRPWLQPDGEQRFPLDPGRWIPDTVEINPDVRLFDSDGTTAAAVIAGIVCFAIVLVIVVATLGFFVWVAFLRD